MGGWRTPTRYPGRIIVTPDRVRKDPGDIPGLAKSIERDGLMHPVVVKPNDELIAGWRRLEAWRRLDRWDTPIPVHVVDIDAIARGEWAENTYRKELTWSERVELARALRPALQEAARQRSIAGRRPLPDGTPPAQIAQGVGLTRDHLAKGLGVSSRSFEKAEALVLAAEEDPVRFGPLVQAMDRTGRVHAPHSRLRVIRQADAIRAEPPPLPNRGPYRVLVIDPPWPFDEQDGSERGLHPYPTMSIAEIRALPVPNLAHEDCALWLWSTNHHLLEQVPWLMTLWGFEAKTILTWGKDKHGRGKYLFDKTEHCVLAIRGKPTITLSAETTLLMAPRGGHSEKPAAFYDLVERVTPASRYCELFSHLQAPRPGWDRHSTHLDHGGGGWPRRAYAG